MRTTGIAGLIACFALISRCGGVAGAAETTATEGTKVSADTLSGTSRPDRPLICLWQHEPQVDITAQVKELGFNTVWTDDPEYTGQRWEDTQMYRALQVPGIEHVIPKIERAAW